MTHLIPILCIDPSEDTSIKRPARSDLQEWWRYLIILRRMRETIYNKNVRKIVEML